MKFERAEEIMAANRNIRVEYEGTDVWLVDLDPTIQKAQVKMPATSNHVVAVSIGKLVERD